MKNAERVTYGTHLLQEKQKCIKTKNMYILYDNRNIIVRKK